MTVSTAACTADTYAAQGSPDSNFGAKDYLGFDEDSGAATYSYLHFPLPFSPGDGSSVSSATLKFFVRKSSQWGSSRTVQVKRLTGSWSESKLTYHNRPTSPDATYEGSTTVSSPSDSQEIDVDVTSMLQDIATNGTDWYGFYAQVASGTWCSVWSSEATNTSLRPVLVVDWSPPPLPPVDLWPAAGAYVGLAQPLLAWDQDTSGSTPQAKSQVQVSTDSTFATTDYDSGLVANTDPEWDLSGTAFSATAGTTYWWRVQIAGSSGGGSGWSDPASFVYQGKGTLSVTAPSGAINTLTPSATWTFTGATQASVEIALLVQDATTLAWDEVWKQPQYATSVTTFQVPPGQITDLTQTYRIRVRVWDTLQRVATVGDQPYVEATSDFTVASASGVAAATGLTATQEASGGPKVALAFTYTGSVDYFAVARNGIIVEDSIVPADVLVSGSTYRIDRYDSPNRAAATWTVYAILNDGTGLMQLGEAASVSATLECYGIWLAVPGDGTETQILGQDQPMPGSTWGIASDKQLSHLVGRRDPVQVRTVVGGYEGQLTGRIFDASMKAALEQIAVETEGTEIRLVFADLNIQVAVGDVSIAPDPAIAAGAWLVSVDVAQTGDWGF